MPVREHERQNDSGSTNESVLPLPIEAQEQRPYATSSPSSKDAGLERITEYEFIDSRELARRLTVPASWIRDQVRARSEDPLPHVNLGKYVRFLWGSPALELWIRRRIVVGNNRRVERVR
jgi:hypothetical protein